MITLRLLSVLILSTISALAVPTFGTPANCGVSPGTSIICSISPTAGSTVFVSYSIAGTGVTASATLSTGQSLTVDKNLSNVGGSGYTIGFMRYSGVPAGVTSVTITTNVSVTYAAMAVEANTGAGGTTTFLPNVFDNSGAATATPANWTSGSITTTVANDVVIGMAWDQGGSATPCNSSAPWTTLGTYRQAGQQNGILTTRTVSATGSYTATGSGCTPGGFLVDAMVMSYTYLLSPTYPPPVCNAGAQQSFATGIGGTLDGTGSTGGSTLTYLWSQSSGPSTGSFSSTTSGTPTYTVTVAGTYVVQLAVTDALSQTTTCTVKDGAVVVDARGIVQTGNSTADTLLGPLLRWGANPWPWYDNRHKASADVQRANFNTYYGDYWNTAATGTVTVTSGSAAVVGVGTSFKATFCGGGTTGVGIAIIVWYPRMVGTGRRQQSVTACADNTHLTLDAAWNGDVSDGSTLSFSVCTFTQPWDYHAAPANYYDNVAAYYSLYYSSGIDDYLTAARAMADRYYQSPEFDAGVACHITGYPLNCFFGAFISRVTQGIVLRAMDGKPEYWDALQYLWGFDHFYIHDYYPANHVTGAIPDARSNGYLLMELGYCGLFASTSLGAPDPTTRAACNADLTGSLATLWTPSAQLSGDHPTFYGNYRTWDNGTSAVLTNGSSTVLGSGAPFTPPMFGNCVFSTEVGCAIWFYDAPAASIPAPVGGGDTKVYFGTYTDASHITLHDIDGNVVPYTGTSGIHGFVTADVNAGSFVGFGNQPYAAGLLAGGFALAGKALRSANPSDPNAALFSSYAVGQANWELTSGTDQRGSYNFSSPAMCRPPMTSALLLCYVGPNDAGSRVQNAEVMRGVMDAYAYNGDSALKTLIDSLFSGMWAKPGFIPTNTAGPAPDCCYIDGMNDTGFYMTGTPPTGQAPKYFGQFFGISELPSWAAVRLPTVSGGGTSIGGVSVLKGNSSIR